MIAHMLSNMQSLSRQNFVVFDTYLTYSAKIILPEKNKGHGGAVSRGQIF
jgi:hypothetical protein